MCPRANAGTLIKSNARVIDLSKHVHGYVAPRTCVQQSRSRLWMAARVSCCTTAPDNGHRVSTAPLALLSSCAPCCVMLTFRINDYAWQSGLLPNLAQRGCSKNVKRSAALPNESGDHLSAAWFRSVLARSNMVDHSQA